MDRSGLERGAVVVMLLLTGVFAWRIHAGPSWVVDASALAAFPERIGPWRSAEVALEPAVEAALGADLNLQRIYEAATGDFVWLYIGYYGTEAGGRPAHTPRGCYPGAGWGIAATRVLDVPGAPGLRVNEYRVERDGQTRLVHFWYRSHRSRSLLGGLDQNLDRLVGRLTEGRADGALVRVSAPLDRGMDEVDLRARLLGFAAGVDGQLGAHWPVEQPAGNPVSAGVTVDRAGGLRAAAVPSWIPVEARRTGPRAPGGGKVARL